MTTTMTDLRDLEARAASMRFLLGLRPWPYGNILTVKRVRPEDPLVERLMGEEVEVGYVRRAAGQQEAELTVRTDTGATRSRTYANLEQLLDDGWRVD